MRSPNRPTSRPLSSPRNQGFSSRRGSLSGPTATMDEVYTPQHNVEFWHQLSKVPNYIAPSIRHINYDHLIASGVKHLVFDIDNTLVTFGARTLDPETIQFLLDLKSHPQIQTVRLASNTTRNLLLMREALQIPII